MTRRPALVIGAVALLALAFLVRLTQPSDEDVEKPFVTAVTLEQPAEGRDLTLTAHDAVLSDRLTTSDWVGETDGVWLVIDATIGSKLGIATPEAPLTIDGVQYTASDRPDDAALGGSLDPGLPQRGAFVFELPLSAVDGPGAAAAQVRFATAFRVRLDSAIDLSLDLTALQHETSTVLQTPGLELP